MFIYYRNLKIISSSKILFCFYTFWADRPTLIYPHFARLTTNRISIALGETFCVSLTTVYKPPFYKPIPVYNPSKNRLLRYKPMGLFLEFYGMFNAPEGTTTFFNFVKVEKTLLVKSFSKFWYTGGPPRGQWYGDIGGFFGWYGGIRRKI